MRIRNMIPVALTVWFGSAQLGNAAAIEVSFAPQGPLEWSVEMISDTPIGSTGIYIPNASYTSGFTSVLGGAPIIGMPGVLATINAVEDPFDPWNIFNATWFGLPPGLIMSAQPGLMGSDLGPVDTYLAMGMLYGVDWPTIYAGQGVESGFWADNLGNPIPVADVLYICSLCGLPPLISVLSHQKISDTQGGFTGSLGDHALFGLSLAALGDLDGDGVEDLVVGAPGDGDEGALWILFLDTDGTVKDHQKISSTEGGFTGGLDSGDQFGPAAAALGDIDGDGVVDLAVGASGDDDGGANKGAVWVLFLNTDGTVKGHQKISEGEGGFLGALDSEGYFGHSVAAVGDIDGDGVMDLAVAAPVDDDGGTERGAIWVLFLYSDGTVKAHQKISSTEGGFTEVLDDYDGFGSSIVNRGDVDGDGVNDLAVGACLDDDGGTDRGAMWLLFLNANGTVKHYQKISDVTPGFGTRLADSDRFGRSATALGDMSGFGSGEFAVGAVYDDGGGTDRGGLWILSVSGAGAVMSPPSFWIGDPNVPLADFDGFGWSAAALGDLNGDGVSDLAVGAVGDDDGGTDHGAVWILFMDAMPIVCGNGILDPLEQCDDGGTANGDGCSAECEIEQDSDGDGAFDTVDNCVLVANPAASYPSYRTRTGGQLDDDADGYGNPCDAKFTDGPIVTALDTIQYKTAISKPVTGSSCGTSGTEPCDQFDLDGASPVITALDTIKFKLLLSNPVGPKCSTCPLACEGDACP